MIVSKKYQVYGVKVSPLGLACGSYQVVYYDGDIVDRPSWVRSSSHAESVCRAICGERGVSCVSFFLSDGRHLASACRVR